MIYNAGILNKRITIIGVSDGTKDGWDTTQDTVICNCWASIQPARGKEYYESQKIRNDEQIKIIIRYRNNIDESCKIKYKNHTYNIQSVVNPLMADESLELFCLEQKRGKSSTQETDETTKKTDTGKSSGGWES